MTKHSRPCASPITKLSHACTSQGDWALYFCTTILFRSCNVVLRSRPTACSAPQSCLPLPSNRLDPVLHCRGPWSILAVLCCAPASLRSDGDLEVYSVGVDRVPGQWVEDPAWRGPLGGGNTALPAHAAAAPSRCGEKDTVMFVGSYCVLWVVLE